MTEIIHRNESVTIKDAKLLFRNLAGREAPPFNSAGDRNFHVVLTPELAQELTERNWRVKQLKPRDDEEGDFHLKVKVNYKSGRPPRVVLVTSDGRSELGADEVALIDSADIANADMVLNGWYNDMAGGGYSAFLKTLVVTIREDELELMLGAIPENGPVRAAADDENWGE